MLENFGKIIVYRSKDKEDWEKAQDYLKEQSLEFKAWVSEEPPVAGCGSKLDIRSFGTNKKIPHAIYAIEVGKASAEAARRALEGKVLPPRSYGSGL